MLNGSQVIREAYSANPAARTVCVSIRWANVTAIDPTLVGGRGGGGGGTIQLLGVGGGVTEVFELDKLFISPPICRTLFFHTLYLKQSIYSTFLEITLVFLSEKSDPN